MIEESALDLLKKIGIEAAKANDRELLVPTSRHGIRLLRARSNDIPMYVARGAADLGITGQDMVLERGVSVKMLLPLGFGKCTLALAVPEAITVPKSIVTALPRLARRLCRREGLKAEIIPLYGALEAGPRSKVWYSGERFTDAIFDQVGSGNSLVANGLRILSTLMESQAYLIANGVSAKEKKDIIDETVLYVQGVLAARQTVFVKVNAKSPAICDALKRVLPALESPDVSPLAEKGAFSVSAAASKEGLDLGKLIMQLKKTGGTDILVFGPSGLELVIP